MKKIVVLFFGLTVSLTVLGQAPDKFWILLKDKPVGVSPALSPKTLAAISRDCVSTKPTSR